MRHCFARALLVPFVAVVLAAPAFAQGVHVDKKNGFQVKPPSGWMVIPLKVEEKWIAAKWMSDKKYLDKESGFEHQPLMRVIIFPKPEDAAASGGKEGGEEPGGGIKAGDVLDFSRPYLNYKDYLKRNFNDGGFFVSAEKEIKIGQTPVTLLEVKIDKLVQTGKKRIFCWEFKAEWATLAIECESLEQMVDKLQPTIMNAFKTFSLIKRDPNAGAGDADVSDAGKIKIIDANETPEQKKERKIKAQEAIFKKALAQLPKDWTSKRTPHFLILNHGSKDFVDKVVGHAEAVYTWMDQNFGDVGKGYVSQTIIRICATTDEERAFGKSSGDAYSFDNREIVLSQDTSFGKDAEMSYLGRNIMQFYFYDKNRDLYNSLPPWITSGFSAYIGSAKFKGGKLDFEMTSSETEDMRAGRRENKFSPLKDLFAMTGREMWSGPDGQYLSRQCTSIIRYLMGPGRAVKKHGTLIKDYIAELLKLLEEDEKKARAEVAADPSDPQSEEEEEEAFQKRKKQNWDQKEKEFLAAVHKTVFEKWTDGDWAGLQGAWEKFSK